MAFERKLPASVAELKEYLQKIFENKSHVKKIEVNETASRVEVTLDFLAHHNPLGPSYPDVYLPLTADQVQVAKELVNTLWSGARRGVAPTDADAQNLFDLIDRGGA
jgi:hypothetical protein